MRSHQPEARPNNRLGGRIGLKAVPVSLVTLLSVALLQTFGSHAASAAGILFFVTSLDDHDDGVCNADCTLREAIQAANSNPGDDDGIEFIVTGTINLTSALPDITGGVEITGPGADMLTVRRSSTGLFRVFNITTTGTVTFSSLTISGGRLQAGFGGGIQNVNEGTVNVNDCLLIDNISLGGGGIDNRVGTVNVTNSMLKNNDAELGGGGINNRDAGTVNVTNSTLLSNRTVQSGGGGIQNFGAVSIFNSLIINNSVISGNGGGGIFNAGGAVAITNSTITFNRASNGAGIDNESGTVNVTNCTISRNIGESGVGIANLGTANVESSIIALNTLVFSAPQPSEIFGSFTSAGFNLVGKADGSPGFTQPTDLTGTIAAPLDPMLDPGLPGDNGGPTQTIALLCGSPAVDKGTSTGLTGNLTTEVVPVFWTGG